MVPEGFGANGNELRNANGKLVKREHIEAHYQALVDEVWYYNSINRL